MLYGALIPFHLTADRAIVAAHVARISLNPFISPDTGRRLSLPDVAQNVLLFLPFGLFGGWTLAGERDRRSTRSVIMRVTGYAVLLSVAAESLQLFTIDRVSSIADVGADTLGACIGAAAWYPLRTAWRRSPAAAYARALTALPAFSPWLLTAVLVCVAAWQPFDVTLDVGNAVQKWHALRQDLWQRPAAGALIIDAIRYALFTLAATWWLRQVGLRRAGVWAVILGIVAAGALEGSEAAIESRMPGIAALLSHLAGVCGGAWLARTWPGERSPMFWASLLAAASLAGAALEWPAQPPESMMRVRWIVELSSIAVTAGVGIALARRTESRASRLPGLSG